jgi:hypothetical protein
MKVRRKFIKLTKRTYPHGTENLLKDHLPIGYKSDGLGNYYLMIGDNPSTMFTCHLDTASKPIENINHVFNGDFIETDKKTILGADDKAGMVVLLSLIENKIPGLYYFFIGEEVGCIGSGRLSEVWDKTDFSKHINKVVSFDRRGTDSVITDQFFGTCCSDEFAIELAKRLNNTDNTFGFKPDPTGVFTDSAKFMELVPECTNISVGYYNEHTVNEKQDIVFLKKLCNAVTKIDWETLPIKRDPKEDSLELDYYRKYYGVNYNNNKNVKTNTSFTDEWHEGFYSYFTIDGKSKKMYISRTQVEYEKEIIKNWLVSSCCYPGFNSFNWNGNSLYINVEYNEFVGNRRDLLDVIPKLGTVPYSELTEHLEEDEFPF